MQKMKSEKKTLLLATGLWLTLAGLPRAQATTVEFNHENWDLQRARIVDHLNRKALMGTAFLKDVHLRDGIIEVDVATTARQTSYPGVLFRVRDAANYERFYLRPHRSPFYDDALQYCPTFNGVDSWQLYNGPGLTSGMEILPNRWNRLKIIVSGTRARVFWNEDTEPVMTVDHLAHDAGAGAIGLSGPMDGSAYFSNLRYEVRDKPGLAPAPPRPVMPGIISEWEISEPFALMESDFTEYPREVMERSSWKAVASDVGGVVDVSRHFARKFRAGDVILARTNLKSASSTLVRTGFGYSDFIGVYLNGSPVYFGNSAYRSRDSSFLGIVGYHDTLFLPLRRGDNELLVMVGESMGGWAFCFRKEDVIRVHPTLALKWKKKGGVIFPEAVVYDPRNDVCYVSNYFNEGMEFISRVSTGGEILEREWIKGLRMPTGMILKGDTLYAVDRSGVNLINVKNGTIEKKIPLPGVVMANDVSMDESGTLYISDTRQGTVFRQTDDRLEAWLQGLKRPNALYCEKSRLLIGQNGKILAADLESGVLQVLARFDPEAGIDGIEPDGCGGYLVADHNGRLYCLSAKGEQTLLLDTSTPGDKIADFAYIPSLKRLIIPTFSSNTLTAYSYNPVTKE